MSSSGGENATKERSSKGHRRGVSASPSMEKEQIQAATDMETDCGPEDVIRWPRAQVLVVDTGGVKSENYSGVGHGKQIFNRSLNNSVQDGETDTGEQDYRLQRLGAASRQQLSSGDTELGNSRWSSSRRSRGDEEWCTTRTKSFVGSCLEATMRLHRPPQSVLVTALLCTYLMLSSLPAVAFAGRQQDGKWTRITYPSLSLYLDWGGAHFNSLEWEDAVTLLGRQSVAAAAAGRRETVDNSHCSRNQVTLNKNNSQIELNAPGNYLSPPPLAMCVCTRCTIAAEDEEGRWFLFAHTIRWRCTGTTLCGCCAIAAAAVASGISICSWIFGECAARRFEN